MSLLLGFPCRLVVACKPEKYNKSKHDKTTITCIGGIAPSGFDSLYSWLYKLFSTDCSCGCSMYNSLLVEECCKSKILYPTFQLVLSHQTFLPPASRNM